VRRAFLRNPCATKANARRTRGFHYSSQKRADPRRAYAARRALTRATPAASTRRRRLALASLQRSASPQARGATAARPDRAVRIGASDSAWPLACWQPYAARNGRHSPTRTPRSGWLSPEDYSVALPTIASVAISARTALASGKIYYGSRVGMTVSVISVQGLNTSNAVIHTKHTRDDAIAFCRDYEQNLTDDCVNRELETPMNDHIAANCSTGVFIDFSGNRYHFEGQRRRPTSDFSKYAIRDLSTGEIEDGTSASGYSTNLGIFHALCVMRAPDTGQ
jgi:hypothetical protein